MKDTRRDFLKKGMAAGMGALFIPELAKAAVANQTAVKAAPLKLKKDAVILFQGDSITDAGRDKANNRCNTLEQLGYGYSLFTATSILEKHAASQPKIYNKGISGNKVFQLRERWEMDCLALQPDVLSILIGVNDYWHTLSGGYKGTVEIYENDLRDLLKYTKEKLRKIEYSFLIKKAGRITFPKDNEKQNLKTHDCRHSYAVHLLSSGVSISLIAKSLGNSVLVCEKYYLGYALQEEGIQMIHQLMNQQRQLKKSWLILNQYKSIIFRMASKPTIFTRKISKSPDRGARKEKAILS
jgi:lysophospholipase L1-like esterase